MNLEKALRVDMASNVALGVENAGPMMRSRGQKRIQSGTTVPITHALYLGAPSQFRD